MIQSFRNKGTEDLYDGKNSKPARNTCPRDLWKTAQRKLDQIDSAPVLNDLRVPSGNRLESLSGNREGQYSLRINSQYRICFVWLDGNAHQLEVTDYHP